MTALTGVLYTCVRMFRCSGTVCKMKLPPSAWPAHGVHSDRVPRFGALHEIFSKRGCFRIPRSYHALLVNDAPPPPPRRGVLLRRQRLFAITGIHPNRVHHSSGAHLQPYYDHDDLHDARHAAGAGRSGLHGSCYVQGRYQRVHRVCACVLCLFLLTFTTSATPTL